MNTCRHGHPLSPENTGTRYRHGDREAYCKTCEAARLRLEKNLRHRSNLSDNLAALAARPAEA